MDSSKPEYKYISQNKIQEVYQVFEILQGSIDLQNQRHLNQSNYVDLNAPLEKFSMLEDKGYTFEIKSNS